MRSWCFDSQAVENDGLTTYDREYGSAEIREVVKLLIGNGVYANPATNMQVTAGSGMTVAVQPGFCWVSGAMGAVDDAETLSLDTSSSGRVDLIVARFDLALAYRSIRLAVIPGTEGSSSPPSLTRNESTYDIQLARINVRAGASSVLQSDIVDTRYNAGVCGIVTGIINQIDATNLFSQFQSVFDQFMATLETTLSGDVAGNLLTLITNHTDDKNNPHEVTKEQVGLGKVPNLIPYSEENKPTKNDVGLGNLLNEKQYCDSNPPPQGAWFNQNFSYVNQNSHSKSFDKPMAGFIYLKANHLTYSTETNGYQILSPGDEIKLYYADGNVLLRAYLSSDGKTFTIAGTSSSYLADSDITVKAFFFPVIRSSLS